jgi:hypothetical protein
MNCKTEPPPWGVAGAQKVSFPGGCDAANTAPKPENLQAEYARPASPAAGAIYDLKKDFICECLRIAALKAQHCADNLELDDLLNCDRDLRLAISHLREASLTYRQLRAAQP